MLVDKEIKISVKNLKKCYGDLEVLKDISTDVTKGEVVCIIGPSGSGKSTFLRCLNQLEKVNAGSIIVDGNNIQELYLISYDGQNRLFFRRKLVKQQ